MVYVARKIATFMCNKVYGKEKTLRLYREPLVRLQMVQIYCIVDGTRFRASGDSLYEIRENRKLLLRTNYYDEACNFFRSRVYSLVSQLILC